MEPVDEGIPDVVLAEQPFDLQFHPTEDAIAAGLIDGQVQM